jgi:hypothetical protein
MINGQGGSIMQDNARGGQRPIRRITLRALTPRNPQEMDAAAVGAARSHSVRAVIVLSARLTSESNRRCYLFRCQIAARCTVSVDWVA